MSDRREHDDGGEEPPPGYVPPIPPPDLPRRVDRVPDDVDISDSEVWHHQPEEEPPAGEDEQDGMCDLDFEMAPRTDDADTDALVLFADCEFTDPDAVTRRAAEWRALFEVP